MKTILSLLASLLVSTSAFAATTLYWNPDATLSQTAGGSGTWQGSNLVWWDGSKASKGGWDTAAFTLNAYLGGGNVYADTLVFGAAGQTATYTVKTNITAIFSSTTAAPVGNKVITFDFQGDYELLSYKNNANNTYSKNATVIRSDGSPGRVVFKSATGKTVTLGADTTVANADGFIITAGSSSTGTTGSVAFTGAGIFNLNEVILNTTSGNGRITVGATNEFTTVNFNSASSITGSLSPTGSGTYYNIRFGVSNGVANINGGSIFATTFDGSGSTLNAGPRTAGTMAAIFVGDLNTASSAADGSTLSINSGTVTALAANNASLTTALGSAAGDGVGIGVLIGGSTAAAAYAKGGTVNLNGGILTTTNIVASDKLADTGSKAILNLNGGTLIASEYSGQAQLNTFIYGFQNTNDNHVALGNNGIVINTGNIAAVGTNPIFAGIGNNLTANNQITEQVATISSAIRNMEGQTTGNLTKTGANTLRLTGNNTYTGDTLVNEGTLINDGTLTSNTTVASIASLSGNGTFSNIVFLGTDATFGNTTGFSAGDIHFSSNLTINLDLTNVTDSFAALITLGNLTADGSTLTLNLSGTTANGLLGYTLLDAASIESGILLNVTGDTAGLTFNTINGQITLGLIPEPSTYALIAALALLTLALSRRRK